jgi:Icc-related predicted phosphoesterase
MTRALFFTDVHGNRKAYEQAAKISFDLVILGGDLFPTGGTTAKDEVEFVRSFLGPWARALGRPIFAVPGNHDTELAVAACEEFGILLTHREARPLPDGRKLRGYPFVPITPFTIKDWEKVDISPPPAWPRTIYLTDPDGRRRYGNSQEIIARGTIEEDIARLTDDPASTVFLVHSPPARTDLDIIYGGAHVGSEAWRAYIERAQPSLTLHGHIHESPQMSGKISHKLGRTLCINPGDSSRRLSAVTFELEDPEATLTKV